MKQQQIHSDSDRFICVYALLICFHSSWSPSTMQDLFVVVFFLACWQMDNVFQGFYVNEAFTFYNKKRTVFSVIFLSMQFESDFFYEKRKQTVIHVLFWHFRQRNSIYHLAVMIISSLVTSFASIIES